MFGGGFSGTTGIILVLIVATVIIFSVVSTILGKKGQKKEREKRKRQVKDEIKQYIRLNDNRRNLRLEYDKVVSRRGKEYKYRDIFDVIVNIYDAKSNTFLEEKAYEIEGISQKVSKKVYETKWKVNQELDVEEAKKRIEIIEKKIKLTKEEKIEQKKATKLKEKEEREEMIKRRKEQKKANPEIAMERPKAEKFAPRK